MDQIVLFKIELLHARVVQPNGIKIRQKGKDVYTGTIAANLDEMAAAPANLGMVNLDSGEISLRWAIIATLPIMADASAAGQVPQDQSGPLKVSFDEAGELHEDGYGFDAAGDGEIASGSLLSAIKVLSQTNGFEIIPHKGKRVTLPKAFAAGDSVRCALLPESTLELAIPKSLGGGTQRVNLVGGFFLSPVMSLGARKGAKRSRR